MIHWQHVAGVLAGIIGALGIFLVAVRVAVLMGAVG